MRNIKFIIINILIFGILSAQTINTKIDKPTNVYIGTPMTLNISIETGLNDSIFTPREDTLDIFVVYNIAQQDSIKNAKKITNLMIKMAPFDTGEHQIPAIDFTVKSGDKIEKLSSQPITVFVKKVTTDSTKTIRGISPLMAIKPGFWDIFVPILILILIVLVIVLLIKKFKNKDKDVVEKVEFIDNRPPYVICLEKLENLKKENLLGKGDFLGFYFGLSMIMREFIALEYKLNAVEMTFYEIKKAFPRKDMEVRKKILNFLGKAERVKFAKYIPSLESSEEMLNWFENFLNSFDRHEDLKNSEEKKNV